MPDIQVRKSVRADLQLGGALTLQLMKKKGAAATGRDGQGTPCDPWLEEEHMLAMHSNFENASRIQNFLQFEMEQALGGLAWIISLECQAYTREDSG